MKKIIVALLLLFSLCLSVFPAYAVTFAGQSGAKASSSGAVHTITFDSDGGSYVESIRVRDGETTLAPSMAPEKEGYRFTGWYKKDGQGFDFFSPVTESVTLSAGWVADTVPSPTVERDTLQFDPSYLEMWQGMTLEINTVATAPVVRADGYKYTRYFVWDVPLSFYTLDSTIASVDQNGNITGHKIGTTYLWAVAKETVSTTFEGVEETYTIEAGAVLGAIEICITGKPAYYKAYESDPAHQQITLTQATNTNVNDFISYPDSAFGSANIAVWYGNANSAVSITVDDNIYNDFAQWTAWYDTYGIPATFMAPTDLWYEYGDSWQQQYKNGMAVQSHSHYHHSSAEYGDARTTAQEWADFYYALADLERANIKALTIGYPCGHNMSSITTMMYIAGRNVGGASSYFNETINMNYNSVKACGGLDGASHLLPVLSEKAGSWLVTYYHSIGKGAATIESYYQTMSAQVEAGTLWAATFDDAAQYAQERDTASVSVLSADKANGVIRLSVVDKMNDELFYHPLSVKVTVDSSWTDARAYQNGEERACKILTNGGSTYVMVDAVPDAGEVTLVRTTTTSLQTDSKITFTVSDASNSNHMPKTVSFAVDGEVWATRTAVQGGRVLDTKLETYMGQTLLSVTAYSNAGEVTVLPTDGADLTSHTMEQLYKYQVKASADIPVLISSASDLEMLSAYTSRGGLTEGITFRLVGNIDMKDVVDFTPIGWQMKIERTSGEYYSIPFKGNLDGAGYTICNLLVNRDATGAGLFGQTLGGFIKDLTLYGNIKGIKYVGSFIADGRETTMENLLFSGNVTSVAQEANGNSGSFVGGLVGRMDSITATNCQVLETTVRAYAARSISRMRRSYEPNTGNVGSQVGGIVGGFAHRRGTTPSTETLLDKCIFTGSVQAFAAKDNYTGEVFGAERVGGLVGSYGSYLNAKNCLVRATVEGKKYVGGLAGYLYYNPDMAIRNCAVYGSVKGVDRVGGGVGEADGNKRAQFNNIFVANTVEGQTNVGSVAGLWSSGAYAYNVCYLKDRLPAVNYAEGATARTFVLSPDMASAMTQLNSQISHRDVGGEAWTVQGSLISPVAYTMHTVKFVDDQNKVIAYRFVKTGEGVKAPYVPSERGKTFDGWVGDFSAVTADITITAVFTGEDPVTPPPIPTPDPDPTPEPTPDVATLAFEAKVAALADVKNGSLTDTYQALYEAALAFAQIADKQAAMQSEAYEEYVAFVTAYNTAAREIALDIHN